MRISTKALLSSLVAATLNAAPAKYRQVSQREVSRYERMLQKHDRKGELRATVLGIDPQVFRDNERKYSLMQIVRRYGFSDERVFYMALAAKIREELYRRGWTPRRVAAFQDERLTRVHFAM